MNSTYQAMHVLKQRNQHIKTSRARETPKAWRGVGKGEGYPPLCRCRGRNGIL